MTTVEELFENLLTGTSWQAGVTFRRTNGVPIDKYSVFETLADATQYAMSAVAYPGQVIAVQENEQVPWAPTVTTQGSSVEVPTFTLSCEEVPPSVDNEPSTYIWHLSCSNGFTTTTDTASGKLRQFDPSDLTSVVDPTPDAVLLSGSFIEGDFHIPYDTGLTNTVDVKFERSAVSVDTWNLYVIDPSAPNGLKKIEGGSSSGGGSSGDVQQEQARAMAVEQALSDAISSNIEDIGKNTSDITTISGNLDNLSGKVETISAGLSNAISTLSDELADGYLPLSGGQLSGDLSVGDARFNDGDITGLTITKDGESYQFGGQESDDSVVRSSDISDMALSSDLSDAMAGGLSNANAENPVMLSSDLSALIEKAIRFKGAVSAIEDVTSADIGDMYIITGNGTEAGAEYVCTGLSGELSADPVWSELGREGTITALWEAVNTLSNTTIPTICTDLSNAITANAENISTLSNTTIPDLCTALSNGITANTESIRGITSDIDQITGDIDDISTDIYTAETGLSAKVDATSANVNNISTDIYTADTGLSAKVDTLTADVDQLTADVDGLTADVDYISSFVSSLPADISTVSSALSTLQDNTVSVQIDGLSSTELNVLHISEAAYHQLVRDEQINPKTIYIVSADGYQNMYGETIQNLSTLSTDISSAANVSFVTAYVGDEIATVTDQIDELSDLVESISGDIVSGMISSVVVQGHEASIEDGVASINDLSVSDLTWDIDVINGGNSGYVPQAEEPVKP